MVAGVHRCLNGAQVTFRVTHRNQMPLSKPPAVRAPGTAGVLSQVREATRASHEAVDALLPVGLRDFNDYRRYLGALLPLVEWLRRGHRHDWPRHLAGWDDRQRLDTLRADCQAMGLQPTPAAAPVPAAWPSWLGACYVIEGSALGARLLSRDVTALAERHPEVRGARRFLDHVTSDPPRWGRFVRLLDALPERHAGAATSGARDGFAIVHSRLAPGGTPA